MEKAIFIDRDGTVLKAIERGPFPNPTAPFSLSELNFEPKVKEALKLFKKLGFLCILVTNQPDVAYGYVSEKEWQRIQKRVERELKFDDVFMCRHPRNIPCYFRKPFPGMLLAAADKWDIDLKNSWMIGDTKNDTGAGEAAGCKTILLCRDYNLGVSSDYLIYFPPHLWKAAQLIKKLQPR